MLERSEVARMLPHIGPEVMGGSYCPLDGHVNSLRLLRALHTGLAKLGASYLPNHKVTGVAASADGFALTTSSDEVRASKVVLAAAYEDDDTLKRMTDEAMATVMKSDDIKEGLSAFIEKRAPQWKGH